MESGQLKFSTTDLFKNLLDHRLVRVDNKNTAMSKDFRTIVYAHIHMTSKVCMLGAYLVGK